MVGVGGSSPLGRTILSSTPFSSFVYPVFPFAQRQHLPFRLPRIPVDSPLKMQIIHSITSSFKDIREKARNTLLLDRH